MENLDGNRLRNICRNSKLEDVRNQQAIFCEGDCGNVIPYNISLINIKENRICVATDLYPNGHLEIRTDLKKMEKCLYNPCNKN